METGEMKRDILKLVDDMNDPNILKNVYDILEKAAYETALRERMIESAIRSEEDIKAGRVFTTEEVRAHLKDYIKKR